MPRFFTCEQVDEMLLLPQGSTRRRARKGQIPAVLLPGNVVRIPKDEFFRWLDVHGIKPASKSGGGK